MNDPQHDELEAGPLSGRLEGISLADLLWALHDGRKTGHLRISRGRFCKTLYLENGRVVFAASNSPDDRLGELFLRQGRITLGQLERAIAKIDSGKRIGSLLVEDGSLTPDELVQGVLAQVESIVLDLFTWEEGEYRFEEGPLPTDEVITLGTSTGELLLKGIRSIRSFSRIRAGVGAPRTIYGLTPAFREALEGLRLGEGEDLLVARLEQGDESVEGLCREVFLSNFEIYQTLWGLKVLGVVEAKPGQRPGEATLQGNLAERGFGELLVELGMTGLTGVLCVIRGARERTFHIRDGHCVFATSNDNDDSLVAYLLRRGVISLRDREETGKRLLSNKRVGTILRELGVIDDHDLKQMVREQLSEIVHDTFRWRDGEYAFVEGDLPSFEEITLEATVQSLVAVGLRRVSSWGRIREGCGGLDSRLALTPTYLDVLDRWDAGPEEWQVINLLKTPATPRDICDRLDLPDFRVCQILWALRVLAAVEISAEAPAVEETAEEEGPAVPVKVDVVDLDSPPVAEPEPEPAFEPTTETKEQPFETDRASFAEEEPSPEETQLISRDVVEAALKTEEPELEPEPESEEEPDEAAATVRLSREEVDTAIRRDEDTAPVPAEVEPEDDWQAPEDLDEMIARFNAVQRVVYRAVKSEVGAGAANLIRACCCGGDPTVGPLGASTLQNDGTWEVEPLRRAVLDQRIEDPWLEYQRLIDVELQTLRGHIGEGKVSELQRQIEKIEQANPV